MIAKISSGLKLYDGIINYHENKVSQDKATVLYSSSRLTNRLDVINYFDKVGATNSHVQNKGHDISINFNPKEVVSDDVALSIIDDYLKQMGFESYPCIVYKHNDKEHQHYHVVVSNINELGVHNEKMRSFYKYDSQKLTRTLEKKYNLQTTNYTRNQKSENLNTINADKYNFQNAIKKGLKLENFKYYIIDKISDVAPLIETESLNDEHLKVLLGENYNDLKQFLIDKKLLTKSLKSQLIESLDHSLMNTSNMDEFIEHIKNKELYIRHIKGDKGFVFGINNPKEDTILYFKETSLPERFRVASFIDKDKKIEFSEMKQKSFIKNNVGLAIKKTDKINEFVEYLKARSIDVVFSENKSGIQGVSFVSNNVKNPIQFKASELNRAFSWNTIKSNFTDLKTHDRGISQELDSKDISESTANIKIEKEEFTPDNTPNLIDIPIINKMKKYDQDDEDDYKKKKKGKRKGR